jgi:hypothetical protein
MWTVKNFPPSFLGKIPVQVRGNPTPKNCVYKYEKVPKELGQTHFWVCPKQILMFSIALQNLVPAKY